MPFDFTPYEFTLDRTNNPPWHMDQRHIQCLHDLALDLPSCGMVIEIGSHKGASTSAFCEAQKKRPDIALFCVEPMPTPEFWRVPLTTQAGTRWRIKATQVTTLLGIGDLGNNEPSLVLIDGDHGLPACQDLAWALAVKARIIVLHDTRGLYGCPGSQECANHMKWRTAYTTYEDCAQREGEFTHRGMMVCFAPGFLPTSGQAEALREIGAL